MPSATLNKSKKIDIKELSINTIRFLAVDGVEKANSGHPGTPMALAPAAYVLWKKIMRYNPRNPHWLNRDRFILSAGHASMLLYSMLHLSGYEVSLEDLKNFRQWHSKTPGHPEYGDAPGIETTTGPLGQGISTAVGMAMAQKYLNSLFTPKGKKLLDYNIFGIASDGDIMEGVASEAASLAGHLGLGSMVFIYDDNKITIDGTTDISLSENVGKRFEAYGWHVQKVADGNDLTSLEKAIKAGIREVNKPTLIILRTHIGYGSPNKHDSPKAHGAPLGAEEVKLTKQNLGWPLEPTFHVPDEVRKEFENCIPNGERWEKEWNARVNEWKLKNTDGAHLWDRLNSFKLPKDWTSSLPTFTKEEGMATRKASGLVINAIAPVLPELLGGSADLAESNNTDIKGGGSFLKNSVGRNLHFGVREHAMGAAVNGLALSGLLIPYGATFLIFSDYMKGAIRIAALTKKRCIYVFTHDSIGLGEDGPTHQPIEQLAHLRATPNSIVIRPADANETAGAWKFAVEHRTGPVSIVLTRQNLPVLTPAKYPNAGQVEKGAYILAEAGEGTPKVILIATGSEVSLALAARSELEAQGTPTRVVSMPSWEIFEMQTKEYKESVLPPRIRARVTIEALSTFGWERYAGDKGAIIGMTSFGASAPGAVAMDKFGFNVANVIAHAKKVMSSENA